MTNDRFSLDAVNFEITFEEELELREEKRKEVLSSLVSKYGEKIISRVIKDCSKKSFMIWKTIYEVSNNHEQDVCLLVEIGERTGLSFYLNKLSLSNLCSLVEKYNYDKLLLESFPYNKDTVFFIDGKKNEALFWRAHNVSTIEDVDFEYIFSKYIEFAPENLLGFFAYRYDYDYRHGITLLKKLADESVESQDNGWGVNYKDYLVKIVDNMDKKYFTNELSTCEFKLLRYLMDWLRDYPMGVKRFFWNNPFELGNVIIGLHNMTDLKSNSVGSQLYFDSVMPIGGNCFIPIEYLRQKKTELKGWVGSFIETIEWKEDLTCRLVKNVIINTLVCYPQNINEDVWPCEEIADIIEGLSKKNYVDRFDVSGEMYSAYFRRRPTRSVNDGSAERALSEQFKIYCEKYKYTHPVVSRALEYISNDYLREAERDKLYSITGR